MTTSSKTNKMNISKKKKEKLTKEEKRELVQLLVDDLEDLTLAGASVEALDRVDRMIAKLK